MTRSPEPKRNPRTTTRGLRTPPGTTASAVVDAPDRLAPVRDRRVAPIPADPGRSLPCRRRSNQCVNEPEQCAQRLSVGCVACNGPDSIRSRADASRIGSPQRPHRSPDGFAADVDCGSVTDGV